jgi:hypothetical protein
MVNMMVKSLSRIRLLGVSFIGKSSRKADEGIPCIVGNWQSGVNFPEAVAYLIFDVSGV